MNKRLPGLSGNQLKIIALVTMTLDHIGMMLLPQFPILRIIGRISFPIFAWLIAEGCRHTRDRKRYLTTMAGFAGICQSVYTLATGSLYLSALVSFTIAICLIYLFDRCTCVCCNSTALWAAVAVFQGVMLLCWYLPQLAPGTDLGLDYGFCGILLPCLAYLYQTRRNQLIFFGFGLILLSLPILALYNGQRGKRKMKYLFYVYYPAHLVAIYLLSLIL